MTRKVEVLDLGTLNGPVLVFGGAVSNLQATQALLAEAQRLAIPGERIICTGDVVAYCADAEATTAALRQAGVRVLMGNCEEALGGDSDDCGCNFAPDSTCDLLARSWYAHAQRQLSADSKAWMRALPRSIRFTLAGWRLLAVHGAPSDISRWIFPSTPAAEKRAEIEAAGVDGVLAGHSGIPFAERVGAGFWVNAGSIGLPANDGTPRGWYAVLRPDTDGLSVWLNALTFDYKVTMQSMRAADLPAAYAVTLESGLWPSAEILPPRERASSGPPLAPVHFRADCV